MRSTKSDSWASATRRAVVGLALALIAFSTPSTTHAAETIYADSLSANWESWSWSSTINYAFSGSPKLGSFAIQDVFTAAWAGLSFHKKGTGSKVTGAALEFYIAYDPAKRIEIYADQTDLGVTSGHVDVASLVYGSTAQPAVGTLVRCVLDLSTLTPLRNDWNRFTWFDATGTAPTIIVDSISVLAAVPPPASLPPSVQVFGARSLLLTGTNSTNGISVTIGAVQQSIVFSDYDAPNQRLLVQLASEPSAGSTISVKWPDNTLLSTTWPLSAPIAIDLATTGYPIIELIYGHAFPSTSDIAALRIPVSRWGGNAVSTFNPTKNVTNAGNDWYFENRAQEDGGALNWMSKIKTAGAKSFLTVPALDWVSKDSTSYSYPKTIYPDQSSFDPYKPDAGNGVTSGGTNIRADPTTAYEPWTTTQLSNWLSTLPFQNLVPATIAVDNELDICSSTHMDIHFDPATYAELLSRVQNTSRAIKSLAGFESVEIAAPSSCCWNFYWNSAAGTADKTAHGNVDFLPWFLSQMNTFSQAQGKRMLDVLDIHYYPNLVFNDNVDNATRALRLRSTRGLWDATYKDEGWIGTDGQWVSSQPNPNTVNLIPRFKSLIASLYPSTKLGIHEWNWGAESDISGGLAIVDVLGIFAREGLDQASYWTSPKSGSAAWLGWWIVRGGAVPFGSTYLPVSFPGIKLNASLSGVYAGQSASGATTLLLVNKDPDNAQIVKIGANVNSGRYSVKYFGQSLGLKTFETALCLQAGDDVVVPAYSAAHLAFVGGAGCVAITTTTVTTQTPTTSATATTTASATATASATKTRTASKTLSLTATRTRTSTATKKK